MQVIPDKSHVIDALEKNAFRKPDPPGKLADSGKELGGFARFHKRQVFQRITAFAVHLDETLSARLGGFKLSILRLLLLFGLDRPNLGDNFLAQPNELFRRQGVEVNG